MRTWRQQRGKGPNRCIIAVGLCVLLAGVSAVVKAGGHAPPPPKDLDARWANRDFKGAILNWQPSAGATSYNIYRATQVIPKPPPPTMLYKKGVKGTTFFDPNVTIGIDTITIYQVTAVNSSGESKKSNIASP